MPKYLSTQREKRPPAWRKWPPKKALHMEKKNTNRFFQGGGASSYSCPAPGGRPCANVIIKCTIFSEIIHHIIISKYTLCCMQLSYFLTFSRKSIPSNPLAIKLNSTKRTLTIDNASGMYYCRPHYLKNYTPCCLNIGFYP